MNKDTETIDDINDHDAALAEWLKDDIPINAREHTIEVIEKALERHSAFTFTWGGKARILVDVQTANLLMTVYKAVNQDSKNNMKARISKSKESFLLLVTHCWKLIK